MKKIKNIVYIFLCMVLASTAFAGCKATTGSDNDGGDGAVSIYSAWVFNTLNPYDTGAFSDAYVFNQVYETFTVRDAEGEIQPSLAESWEISEDGLTYTFKLVQGAKFHNGEELKASDVVFTYDYCQDYAPKKAYYEMVKNVEAVDDYTVVITLDKPTPLFLDHSQQVPIINEKFVKDNNNDITQVACGTGPYKISNYDPAVRVSLEAFEDYRLGEAKIKNVNIDYVSDGSSAVVSLESGDINYMSVPASSVEPFLDNDSYNTEEVFSFYTAMIAMNTEVEPFDNKLVRKAFSYAIDKQSIVTTSAEGYAEEARIIGDPENVFGIDFSKSEDISYNPEKAKELLAEAGYPDGMDLAKDFDIYLQVIPGTHHEKSAQIVQKNLADIGVTIELKNDQTPDENVEAGNFAIMTQGNTYRTDFSYSVSNYGTIGIGGNNFSRMSDSYVDEMFEKGAAENDPDKRVDIYKDLIAYIIDYSPTIPLFNRKEVYVWDTKLNANVHPSAMFPFYCYEWSWNE